MLLSMVAYVALNVTVGGEGGLTLHRSLLTKVSYTKCRQGYHLLISCDDVDYHPTSITYQLTCLWRDSGRISLIHLPY